MSRFVPRWVLSQVSEGRHKYAAHKIALLYHAINTSKLCRDHLRKRIEEHFEDIKEVCTAQLLACASHAPHHVPACTAPRACMHRTTCLHAGSRQATETAESPTLPTPLVEWIVTLCDEVHQLVLEVRLARSPPCHPVAIPRPNHDCHPNRNCHPRCQTRCAISSHPPLNTSQGSADTSGIFPGQAERCP